MKYNFRKFTKKQSETKIFDEFTDLSVSRQRKWQLRHPEKNREIQKRYKESQKIFTFEK
jgi:hypothetical protein